MASFAKSIVCKVMAARASREQRLHRRQQLERHPVREALLELIGRDGVVTATAAARELGGSTGLYSFHLRQLARFGVIEEAPSAGGRVRVAIGRASDFFGAGATQSTLGERVFGNAVAGKRADFIGNPRPAAHLQLRARHRCRAGHPRH